MASSPKKGFLPSNYPPYNNHRAFPPFLKLIWKVSFADGNKTLPCFKYVCLKMLNSVLKYLYTKFRIIMENTNTQESLWKTLK